MQFPYIYIQRMENEEEMAKKEKRVNLFKLMMEGITIIFLVIMIGIFPLYYRNYYLDILIVKNALFQSLTIGFLAIGIVFVVPSFFWERKEGNRKLRISLTDAFAIIFFVTVIISCLLSPIGSEAFWGNERRRLGGLFLLLCIGVYFMVSRFYKSSQLVLWVFLIANYIVFMLIILNFCGIDLLHMYDHLKAAQHKIFIGTLGNINMCAEYAGVVTTLMMGFYYLAKEKLSRICYFVAIVMGIYSCIATRADSWLLAVGPAYLVFLAVSMHDTSKLQKWWELCIGFFCGSFLVKITEVLNQLTGIKNLWISDLRIHFLQYTMISWKILFLELAALVVFWLLLHSKYVKYLNRYGNKILLGAVIISMAVIAAVIFPLEDSFGTNRGYIWKRTLINFKDMPFLQQIFGYGPNSFQQSMEENYGAEIRSSFTTVFWDAHNEPLQFLATTGILGMVSYMGMQISLMVSCIRQRNIQPAAVIGCAGIVAYMLQALVNNPQVFTTPLLFIFLGVMENKVRKTNIPLATPLPQGGYKRGG
ncbi:O-antigen ligase family protein [Konateibacter massiliensis]|uniref:O-antigen ligase family protein n=1 Tax=Konateibacter massiliensis TaxID=2002841 RepID=UPI000C152D48|nr:O-antigen ligase family protein [Konateibacter massiliensis]